MKIAKIDDFETGYVNKFRALASPFGLFLEHEKDRAALDLGMHFTQAKADGSKIVTPAIAWFQLFPCVGFWFRTQFLVAREHWRGHPFLVLTTLWRAQSHLAQQGINQPIPLDLKSRGIIWGLVGCARGRVRPDLLELPIAAVFQGSP